MDNDTQRLTMTIEECGKALGISRATAYSISDRLGAIRIIERRLVVPRAKFLAMLEGNGQPKS